MKFKNLHDDKITIIAPQGTLTARPGEIIELDETTYNAVKTIFTKLELVKETVAPKVAEPVAQEKPKVKVKANKKCK